MLENLNGHWNLPHSNPLNAYLCNVKTVEVYKGRVDPYTKIDNFNRRIKKVGRRAFNTEHME